MQGGDPYEVLGVPKDATEAQIKSAYRKASAAAHPDRQGGSHERMQLLNAAYAILRDPEARKQWDEGKGAGKEMSDEEKALVLLRGAGMAAISAFLQGNDPIEAIRDALEGQVGGCQNARVNCHRQIEKLRELAARLRGPTGNFLESMVLAEITRREETLPDYDKDERLFELALSMLKDYSLAPEVFQEILQIPTFRPFLGRW